MTNFWAKRSYAESSTEPAALAKRGLVYLVAQKFDIASAASVSFDLFTNTQQIEISFYTLANTGEPVYAELIESASATLFGSAVPARNLNREYPDTHDFVMRSASAVTGGTVIASELFGSDKALGGTANDKIHTLAASTHYVMSFVNLGNQTATCHINLGLTQDEPGQFPLVRNLTN